MEINVVKHAVVEHITELHTLRQMVQDVLLKTLHQVVLLVILNRVVRNLLMVVGMIGVHGELVVLYVVLESKLEQELDLNFQHMIKVVVEMMLRVSQEIVLLNQLVVLKQR